jgi:hypothetical protein
MNLPSPNDSLLDDFQKNKDGVIVGNNSVWELVANREKVKVKNG